MGTNEDDTAAAARAQQLQRHADKWVDGKQAAAILGVHRSHVNKLIERGVITPYRIGHLNVYWRADVQEARDARGRWYGR